MARIGVLALQGSFCAHAASLARLNHHPVLIRGPLDFARIEGLVLPGGESTVQLKLIARNALEPAIRKFAAQNYPMLATCAGAIIVAKRVYDPQQPSIALCDIGVRRNAYGRQIDSFEAVSENGRPLVFIRAPRFIELGPAVQVLDSYRGEAVLLKEGRLTLAAFHPELADPDCATDLHREVFGVG